VHVQFGSISDAQGQPLSTRRGNMVYLAALLDDAIARARGVVEQKNPDLPAEEKDRIAEDVGIGAVIYNDLYQDTRRNITLDWDRMLATEGNSATYLQYSYARCRSIIRRASEDGSIGSLRIEDSSLELLTHPAEQQLIKHLARLPEAAREASARYAPFVIADWCYTTAREFAAFFEKCPVLRADTADLRNARLVLVSATAQALKNGLALLGIRAPERM
jgi:arginyl-tRNA synthetase